MRKALTVIGLSLALLCSFAAPAHAASKYVSVGAACTKSGARSQTKKHVPTVCVKLKGDKRLKWHTAPGGSARAAAPRYSAPTTTVAQDNATKSAQSYLNFMSFSRDGLIKQLQFDGFSFSDASYGADAVHADWYTQATRSAASYLTFMAFSHAGLVHQLEFDGYTPDQAEYGVRRTGL